MDAIRMKRDGRQATLLVRFDESGTYSKASSADLAAAGYVPAESSQQQANAWVPVSERLPDIGQGVVLVGWYGDGETRFYHPCTFADAVRSQFGDAWDDVTHWMPLPPPPEADRG